MSLAKNIKQEMCNKMMYNIVTFKNVHQMAKVNNAKLQLLLHQPNMYNLTFSKMGVEPSPQPLSPTCQLTAEQHRVTHQTPNTLN